MKFTLPVLPYAYDALEPYIDARTMEIHYTKHHQAYIDNLNAALDKHPELKSKTLEELLKNLEAVPADIRTAVRNHGGGHLNHSFFWPLMKKGAARSQDMGGHGLVAQEITKTFGSIPAFQEQFNTAAKGVFGSGWAWLALDNKTGKLVIQGTPNQDSLISSGLSPILGLDVWEHAYYLHYQNKRADYIGAWWQVVNWEQVEENYRGLTE
jgi:Fe-Mn family superoxide dismutase